MLSRLRIYLLFLLPTSILPCLFLYFSLTYHPFQFLIFLCVNCLIALRAFLNQQNLLKQNKFIYTFYLIKILLYSSRHVFKVSDMAAATEAFVRFYTSSGVGLFQITHQVPLIVQFVCLIQKYKKITGNSLAS